jgi:autotransporter translocation and assembly factor TamB
MGFKRRLLIRNATSREQALGYNLNKSNPLTKPSQQQIPVNPSPLSSLDHPLNVSEIPLNESNLAFDQSQLRIDHNLTHIDISQSQQKGESDYKKYLRVKDALWKQIENSPKVKAENDKITLEISREQENLYLAKRSSKPTYTQPSGEFNAKSSNSFYGNRPNRQSELNQKQFDQFHNFTQQEDFNRDNPNYENSSRKYERERSR